MAKNGGRLCNNITLTLSFEGQMIPNGQNIIRNEFNAPKSIELDVLHMYIL